MTTYNPRHILLIGLTCCLVACGGGGGGGSSSNDTQSSNTSSSGAPTVDQPASQGDSSSDTGSGKTVSISWEIPTTREDGEALLIGDIRGYEIYYYSEGSPEQGSVVTLNDPSTTEYTTGTLNPGTYYFAISCIDTSGAYSELSDYVSVTIP